MINPRFADVVVHPLTSLDGQRAQVVVTSSSNVAFVYGADDLDEVTLVVQARCPFNGDALDVATCDCAARRASGLEVVRRAPLGAFVYLRTATDENFADVLVVLAHLPNVARVFMPSASAGDVALLRAASDYEVVHRPRLLPASDSTWPQPRRSPQLRVRDRITGALRDIWIDLGGSRDRR